MKTENKTENNATPTPEMKIEIGKRYYCIRGGYADVEFISKDGREIVFYSFAGFQGFQCPNRWSTTPEIFKKYFLDHPAKGEERKEGITIPGIIAVYHGTRNGEECYRPCCRYDFILNNRYIKKDKK